MANNQDKFVIDGYEYSSLDEFIEAYNLDNDTIAEIAKNGTSLEEVAKKYSRKISLIVDGVSYKSKRELADAYGIKYGTLLGRINKQGLTPEEAVNKKN